MTIISFFATLWTVIKRDDINDWLTKYQIFYMIYMNNGTILTLFSICYYGKATSSKEVRLRKVMGGILFLTVLPAVLTHNILGLLMYI